MTQEKRQQRRLTCGEKRQMAAQLRKSGKDFAEIGALLGVSPIKARDYCIQYARILAIYPQHNYWMELSNRAVVGLLCSRLAKDFGEDLDARFARLPQIATAYRHADLLAEDTIGAITCAEIEIWLTSKGLAFQPPAADITDLFVAATRSRAKPPGFKRSAAKKTAKKTAKRKRPAKRRRSKTIEMPQAPSHYPAAGFRLH